jgi:NitT/TauT family transport system ATP-binding protein
MRSHIMKSIQCEPAKPQNIEAGPSAEPSFYHLHYRNVSRWFGAEGRRSDRVVALDRVTVGVRPREIVAVIGPSGCGKSTLLSLGAGLDAPNGGTVEISGEPVKGPRPDVAFMLQKDLLLPWRSISENVEFGVEIRGMSPEERRARADGLLERFGLLDFARMYPYQLSGGMRQRAALARTMALQPTTLLMDEPFSALDAQTKIKLQGELVAAVRAASVTALVITHDLTEAVVLADRIYVMSPRPGRIIKEIRVDLPKDEDPVARYFDRETTRYVREVWSVLSSENADC